VTDPIAEALDVFVPAFGSVDGDWQGILRAAASPAAVAPVDRQSSPARWRMWRRVASARRSVRVAIALAVLAIVATGATWAAGVFSPSPPALFGTYFPADTGSGNIVQNVIPDTVKQIATVDIPKVGPIALWHADTTEGGYCLGLRLSDGSWLGLQWQEPGTLAGSLAVGGVVPGCFPTGVISGARHHLEWLENDIDASSVGGTWWRIRSGVITVPGAVKVTDLATGQSTNVVDGDVFILPIEAPDPFAGRERLAHLHLVAYDKDGNVIASDCSWGSCSAGGYKP
jgi:hypothetical protein